MAGVTTDPSVERLERRLERERRARVEAEQIAEVASREGYERMRELRLLELVAAASNSAATVDESLEVALAAVCEHIGWPVGHAYLVEEGGRLRSASVWVGGDDIPGFKRASEEVLLVSGQGLPGSVLADREPGWMEDAPNEPGFFRGGAAAEAGLRAACAVPALVGDEVRAVLEFFANTPQERDEQMLDLVGTVGTAIGRVFERQQQREYLEREIGRRTADLVASNGELEAFCYSVSHDLRTPLRSMDGFSQALVEDYGDTLDEDALDYLHRIRGASQRMGQLIDDLLALSQVTRADLEHEQIDLSALARQVGRDLAEAHGDRAVELEVEDGLAVVGDERLLRVLVSNLLGNAWKFTAGRDPAHVQVAAEAGGVVVVRDDGAGFDMQYADHLFGAFQRLHRANEYPGTGIGLATVQRIVHRHGGRIWGEGELDRGATFRFTLSPEEAA